MNPNKSKPVTTSVPSISIKFHANAEQIEELYTSEDETNTNNEKAEKAPLLSSSPSNIGEPDSSPLRYLPRLGKRSTSIDVSPNQHLDASPPSDPWRFFSDIKGKITKSVEEKITEIKSRNHEEGSPHKIKTDLKTITDSKENSSISDSEELSESSISKTCGIVSTTEGVEMSSDEDTPSLDKDKTVEVASPAPTKSSGLSHRFRLFKNKNLVKEGTVKVNDLSKLYNINAERIEQALPEDSEDVESAVDALEEANFKTEETTRKTVSNEDVLKSVTQKFDNINLDNDNLLSVKEISGKEIRHSFLEGNQIKTVFAPTGFVDLRPVATITRPFSNYVSLIVLFASIALYIFIHHYSPFLAGFTIGIIITYICTQIYLKIVPPEVVTTIRPITNSLLSSRILELESIKEYQPLSKYQGWVNEYPDVYDPNTYHISQTQSVYIRLQGHLLRISHSKSKLPKRAMWNEPDITFNFNHHRIYNLLGAKITLLPQGLAKKRHWSKKYPICITLSKDQMNFEPDIMLKLEPDDEKDENQSDKINSAEKDKNKTPSAKDRKGLNRFKRREYPILAQRFSQLTQDDNFDLESDSRASTPSADMSDGVAEDISSVPVDEDLLINTCDQNEDDFHSLPDDWSICSPSEQPSNKDDSSMGIKIYIFGRTDREKEDWFRRFCAATHKGVDVVSAESGIPDIKETVYDNIEAAQTEIDYLKYMSVFKPTKKHTKYTIEKEKHEPDQQEEQEDPKSDLLLWLNAIIGRILFDCVRSPSFTLKVRERIQRKLYTIKLPYFIEELLIPELSLGKTPPFIHKAMKPVLDERGLWIDLDITYEGMIVLTLQTKLNLMRLKNPQAYEKNTLEKSAIYHSDVDDSAESSSDEDGPQEIPSLSQDSNTTLMSAASGSSNSGKKFIKMVDRLTESKFFQAATENRYIKKAMEGVSNTDLRLTVEVKAITGTLVLNIPPPPSDRVWVGFRPVPEIAISARPVVGERNLNYFMVTSWIEKKLLQEFQKIMVIPNMEDFVIPVMNPKLPD